MDRVANVLAVAAVLLISGCRASIPEEEHQAKIREQQAEYEERIRRMEDEFERSDADQKKAKEEAEQGARAAKERIEQIEAALADKQRLLSDVTAQLVGLQEAFGKLSRTQRSKMEARTAEERQLDQALANVAKKLEAALKPAFEEKKVEVSADPSSASLVVRFVDGALFARGSARLDKQAKATVEQLATVLKELPDMTVRAEAHTDDLKPGKGSNMRDTWALTSQQGLAVVRALQRAGVDPSRLATVSFGQFRPISSNETAEGRQQNRRLELRLMLGASARKK